MVQEDDACVGCDDSMNKNLEQKENPGDSLAKMKNQIHVNGRDIELSDVLFVAVPSQSWYQKDSHSNFDGFKEYEQRICATSKPYDQISLIRDSMGGSGYLLFSH